MTQTIQDSTIVPHAGPLTVAELARRVEGSVDGDGTATILGVSSIEDADAGDLVFAENARFLSKAARSRASAIVACLDAVVPDKPLIRVENPRYAFVRILEMFRPRLSAPAGVHPTSLVASTATLGSNVSIGPYAVIGEHARIGDRVAVMAGCHVGEQCSIGHDAVLHPHVTLYPGVRVGDRAVIHSGTVVGADGFGYMPIEGRAVKVPHIGTVEIGEDVEIGANCTIDRAKTGATVVGARTKVDNLVHIAHNCKIGPDCIIVAQVGVAGSAQVGRGVTLAGQAGIKDHITIGDGAVVMAQAGVFGSVPAGQKVSGYPARPHMERLRQDAEATHLTDYARRLRALEKLIAELAARNERLEALVRGLAGHEAASAPAAPGAAGAGGTDHALAAG